jgi:hypothetical protein
MGGGEVISDMKQPFENVMQQNPKLLNRIKYESEWLDWFYTLDSHRKNFTVIRLIKNCNEKDLQDAKMCTIHARDI